MAPTASPIYGRAGRRARDDREVDEGWGALHESQLCCTAMPEIVMEVRPPWRC